VSRERSGARPSFGASLPVSGWTRIILWMTRCRGERASWVTHVFNVHRDGETCIESSFSGTRERDWREAYDTGKHWGVLVEIRGFTDDMWIALEDAGVEYLGTQYGFLAVARHGIDGLLGKFTGRDVFFFRKMAKRHPLKYNICSWFTTHTHRKAGWFFEGPDGKPLNPGRATPDDVLDDVFERRPDCYRIVTEFGMRPKKLPAFYCHKIDRDLREEHGTISVD
jgi:hypothetical protein